MPLCNECFNKKVHKLVRLSHSVFKFFYLKFKKLIFFSIIPQRFGRKFIHCKYTCLEEDYKSF